MPLENAGERKTFPRPERLLAARVAVIDNHVFRGVLGMRGILLWLIGIPIPIIILLYLFKAV